MTILEHLGELRSRIIKSVLAVVLGAAVGFVTYNWLLDIMTGPYCDILAENGIRQVTGQDPGQCSLYITDPLEGFSTRIRVSFFAGIALAMPIVLWQIWRFVTPALHPREKRYAIPFVVSAVLLFALGAGLAFWTLPRALDFLIAVAGEQVDPFFTPAKYLNFVTFMMLAFGVGFEFPIVLIFLQLAGIIRPSGLRRFRRYAIVLIVVLVAVITPSGDPISLAALSIPMYVFYEASIVIGYFLTRNRVRE
jgi:sec-independent protein translocase protein TatC